jgi:hypothetical protein
MTFEVGDWIAFHSNGQFVIDRVECIIKNITGKKELVTTHHGTVAPDYVYACRREPVGIERG